MSGKQFPVEFVYQVFSLLIAFIIVHGAYVTVIRPQADLFLEQEKQQLAADPQYEQQRNFYVVVRDYEQEACFVLMFWALAILGFKGISVYRQQRLLDRDLLKLPAGLPVGVEDTAELAKRMDELPEKNREYL
ncbi:MAG: MotA/TolQ/ExbB proton channel family protein, partial [Deltaproteobacteria bacterium]|nr:MotA/TolQ/ExbB proton channel family protein [Deltaproteobacteria bacterium]